MGAETLLFLAAAGAGAAAGGAFGGGPDIPQARLQASQVQKETAAPVEQISETARKNRRLSASLLTKDFVKPTLSQPGLLGT